MGEISIRSAMFPLVRGLWKTRVVAGLHYLNGEPCFLYGNHSNNFDPFLVNWDVPLGHCSSGVLTAEFMQKGLIPAAFRSIGLLSTRKRVPEPHLVGRILRLLRAGRNVLIYPEGGRRWDGRPATWISSTAKLFSRTGVPVHPVITNGSYVAWPRWADWPRPARIEVTVLPAVDLSDISQTEEAVARLSAPIAQDENLPPPHLRPTWAFRPADGIERLLYRDPVTGEHGGLFTEDGHRISNAARTMRWRMLPDSRILDEESGEIHLTGDLYHRIRNLPLEPTSDGYLLHNHVTVLAGAGLGAMLDLGRGAVSLSRTHLRLKTLRMEETIGLEDVLYAGVERNYKLQITLRDRILELHFTSGGSALQWEDAFQILRPVDA
ncbi:MAG: 1-acyl-sn-glycerol-3-phosphate acyltransferase [Rhodothermales bacterium]